MAYLIKIGNSQGIRIPKPLIEQAQLEGKELKFKVLNGGLFVIPIQKARQGWKESIQKILTFQGIDAVDQEWLDAELTTYEDLE